MPLRISPASRHGVVVVVFSATILLSAALVFLVQPMVARLVLPLLGGTSAVWTTSMLFFTTALLAAYVYAHLTARRLGPRGGALLHLAVVAAALVTLPVGLPSGWTAPTGPPALWLLAVLALAAGLPFAVVATTSPLLQRWLSETDHPDAADPYFLYRSSNLGSLAGLLAYPLVIEPALPVDAQTALWSWGFAAFAVLLLACVVIMARTPPRAAAPDPVRLPPGPAHAVPGDGDPADGEPADGPAGPADGGTAGRGPLPRRREVWRRARWVGLAFAPASLTQGVTTYLTVDLAPVPLLWVAPLALYLLSFVIVFARGDRPARLARILGPVFPVVALALVALLIAAPSEPVLPLALTHLACLFVIATYCHGRLAADRPGASALTAFYGWVALGGALGTAFNGLLAPAAFDSLAEYPIALAVACLLAAAGSRRARAAALAPVLIIAVWLPLDTGGAALYRDRDFFGVKRVTADGALHTLRHGTTTHGAQLRTDPREPQTYYHRSGPLGELLSALPDRALTRRAAVIGLGTGTAACLASPGDRWTFYEIDPQVVDLARDPRLFTYLRDCGPHDVVLGDARQSLTRARDGEYGVMIFDAFSSDAVPAHLITREAVDSYRRKLRPGGVMAFHISNRYLDLEPVLGALARRTGLTCVTRDDSITTQSPHKLPSHWLALTAAPASLGSTATSWTPCATDAAPWTDAYSNLLTSLRLDLG
ncbi:spermidine synthase [Bailinhaonella thermotolerans]|uniref:Spermidine synthase n=1 Tax=Bailinhaonella thermotolerans TaxID=1070861 RepID=A0A3A4AZJ0_9ACTN|nr:fused MFS/spermidine synthase [Bailinhaonella thermotolerans]RJL24792.1 hypothetical protein D5H75_28850 [Bailinhaonella thermotolerans]